ncbi:LuxR C-terminal-related transcriptional regulator [Streptomyces sp. NPDC058579]|uniref:LuxR C-terminal-related transcriptional regulator n=1 Tax=Streptomyces sp. NPDC058579 TaxID=3346548 RepID=UPI00365278CE
MVTDAGIGTGAGTGTGAADSAIDAPGRDDNVLTLYQELRRRGVSGFGEAYADLRLAPEEYERCRDALVSLGLIVPTGAAHATVTAVQDGSWRSDTDVVAAVDPEIALLRLLERERERLREHLAEADRAYSTLETLAGTFLRADALTRAEAEVEALTDYRRIQQAIEDITDVMQESSASLHPGTPGRQNPERMLDRDRRQIGNGVRVRAIYGRQEAALPEMAEFLGRRAELGVEIRLAPSVPLNLIIADRQFALVPIRPEDPGEGAILARGSALVRPYLSLYEHCWHTATPYGDDAAPERGGDGLSEQQRAALHMLASGMKDEKIARTLGVSLRTVSRMISELMQELGASSRFEAGARAVRLGWLD